MPRHDVAMVVAVTLLLLSAIPAGAISNGAIDTEHQSVGAIVVEVEVAMATQDRPNSFLTRI